MHWNITTAKHQEIDAALTTNGIYMALENMIVERPLRAMSVHRVCELGTKANGYLKTTSGSVFLSTTS